jgi:hypothetical protein
MACGTLAKLLRTGSTLCQHGGPTVYRDLDLQKLGRVAALPRPTRACAWKESVAEHAALSLNDRQEARRQVGFADQIFISKIDLVSKDELILPMVARCRLSDDFPFVRRGIYGDLPLSTKFAYPTCETRRPS